MSLTHSCPICHAALPDNQDAGPCPSCASLAGGVRGDAWWTGTDTSTLTRSTAVAEAPAISTLAPPAPAAEPPRPELPEGEAPWTVVALGLGLIGFGLSWVPRLGMAGLLLGVPAVLVGLLGALRGRRRAKGMPLMAALIGAQAALAGVWFTFAAAAQTPAVPPPPAPEPETPAFFIDLVTRRQRTVQELIDDTRSTNSPKTRAAALEQLGDMSEGLARAVPVLTEILVDHEQGLSMRANAARALGRIGSPARAAYPALLEILEADEAEPLRGAAEKARDQLGQPGPGDLPCLLEDLRNPRADFRRAAAKAITWAVNPSTRQAIGPLEKALDDDNDGVRGFSAYGLYLVTGQADKVLPVLRSVLAKSPDQDVRHGAAYALTQMNKEARPALPELTAALEDTSLHVRLWAALAHWNLEEKAPPVLPVFMAVLSSDNLQDRTTAVQAIAKLGPLAAPAVAKLVSLLDDPDTMVRALAARALASIGAQAAPAVPRLCTMARAGSIELRGHAVFALSGIGPAAVQAVPMLVELLGDPELSLRGRAADALSRIGKPAKAALPQLERALAANKDPLLRVALARALWSIDERGRLVLPILIEVVANDKGTDEIRIEAARVLGEMGKAARAAVPALVMLADKVNDPSGPVAVALELIGTPGTADVAELAHALRTATSLPYRRACVQTLFLLGAEARVAIPELRTALKDPDLVLQLTVIETFGVIARTREGHASVVELLPQLRGLLSAQDKDEDITAATLETLAALGPDAKPALAEVPKLLKANRPRVRMAAALLIGSLGSDGRPALADLTERLKDDNAMVRFQVAQAILAVDRSQRSPLPVLQALLADKEAGIRGAAATVLGDVGGPAKDALPALRDLQRDPEEEIRKAAIAAVLKIEKGL